MSILHGESLRAEVACRGEIRGHNTIFMLLSSWDFPPSLQWIEPRTQKKRQEGQTYSISQCLLPPAIQRPTAQGSKGASVGKKRLG